MSNTAYPTSIDSPTNPVSNQKLNSPSHSAQHGLENDAIVALETKVGVDGSAVSTSLDYLVKNTASLNPGHKHSFSSLSDFTVSSPSANQVLYYTGSTWANGTPNFKFGGTGSDGALAISSGTTTINCANAALVIKNYSSISITGTGTLAFSNPHPQGTIVILKSQGNVTLISSSTPMIGLNGFGAAKDTNGWSFTNVTNKGGNPSGGASGTFPPTIGIYKSPLPLFTGAGGATATGGRAGGAGGGGLVIECGGAFNFTTTSGISVAGAVGTIGTTTLGGGGGGGGGSCIIMYNTLTANTGTITIAGGNGGAGAGTFAGAAGVGGNGNTGGTGIGGAGDTTGGGNLVGGGGGGTGFTLANGGSGGADGGGGSSNGGGGGASGLSIVQANVDFA